MAMRRFTRVLAPLFLPAPAQAPPSLKSNNMRMRFLSSTAPAAGKGMVSIGGEGSMMSRNMGKVLIASVVVAGLSKFYSERKKTISKLSDLVEELKKALKEMETVIQKLEILLEKLEEFREGEK